MSNSGWICPKCQKVYAPFMMECTHCNRSVPLNEPINPINNPETEKQLDEFYKMCGFKDRNLYGHEWQSKDCNHEWKTYQVGHAQRMVNKCDKCGVVE